MDNMDLYIYLGGIAASIYFAVCLLGGLLLCTNLLPIKSSYNVILSRLVGIILLLLSCSTVMYIIAYIDILFFSDAFVPDLYNVGKSIDAVAFCLITCVGYLLYSNNQPKKPVLALLSMPFLLLLIAGLIFQVPYILLQRIADALMIALFIFFCYKFHLREKTLEHIYSDPDSHSLKWLSAILALFVVWVVLREVLFSSFSVWYDIVLYIYMTCINFLAVVMVLRHSAPVSIRTQEEIEQLDSANNFDGSSEASQLQKELLQLFAEQRLFLDHDLTVETMSRCLGTSVSTLSSIIRYEMKTTFTKLVNGYRIEYAKELLQNTDYKIDFIALTCGFNSRQVFNRTFIKYTGKKPSEWREELF